MRKTYLSGKTPTRTATNSEDGARGKRALRRALRAGSRTIYEQLAELLLLTSPTDVLIDPVDGKRDLNTFLTLPRRLYGDMDGFTAPADMEQASLLHPSKNPVFRHCDVRYFLARRDGRPVGRIAAIIDRKAQEYLKRDDIGSFGALAAPADKAIVFPLLKAAENWLRERGIAKIDGPTTLTANGESGLLLEGFEAAPMIATPWTPPGMAELLEEYGYARSKRLLSYRLELTRESEAKFKLPGDMELGQGRLKNLEVKCMSKKEIVQQSKTLLSLYNDAWDGKNHHVPITDYEIEGLLREIKLLLKPEHYVQINRNGTPVAMALVLPNVYDIFEGMDGRPSLLDWPKIGYRILRHRVKSARVILLGVSKKIRGTMLGALVPALIIQELFKRRHKTPYQWVELGWIQEDDAGMRNLAESLIDEPYKVHGMFTRDLTKKPQVAKG